MDPPNGSRRQPLAPLMRVLEHDPDLAEGLDPAAREEAATVAVARSQKIDSGDRVPLEPPPDPGFGLLVIDGLLLRDVMLANRIGSEIVGTGDVLQPWLPEPAVASVPLESRWRALEPTRVAVLDRAFLVRIAPWPQISESLAQRLVTRMRVLAGLLVISRLPRVEARLLVLFAQLADRWGRVRRDGIAVPIDLTHDVIGALVGAQRPTVTSALSALAGEGVLQRTAEGWLLQVDPLDQLERFSGMETTRRWSDLAL